MPYTKGPHFTEPRIISTKTVREVYAEFLQSTQSAEVASALTQSWAIAQLAAAQENFPQVLGHELNLSLKDLFEKSYIRVNNT